MPIKIIKSRGFTFVIYVDKVTGVSETVCIMSEDVKRLQPYLDSDMNQEQWINFKGCVHSGR